MKKSVRRLVACFTLCLLLVPTLFMGLALAEETEAAAASVTSMKAVAAAITITLACVAGAIALGLVISKCAESISRQPEASGDIRSSMMLGLVFIETAIIYALIIAILIVFVL